MQICRLDVTRLRDALELVGHVFEECDAKDYEERGRQTFHYFIRYENMRDLLARGELVFFGAYEENRLIGVVAMRHGFHVSLLFVEKEYQRRGVGKRLVRCGVAYCLERLPDLKIVTVNASPNGYLAYEAMGFSPVTPEQEKDGMRYTPMRLDLVGI